MTLTLRVALGAAVLGLSSLAAQATSVTIVGTDATAGVQNPAAAADGYVPPNWTNWSTDSAYWSGAGESIVFTLDQAYSITSATVTLDWNDIYRFSVSNDGVNYTALFTTSGLFDQVGSSVSAGQVTLSPSLTATLPTVKYIMLQALYGDNSYAVGEVSFNGVAAVVPEPATLALLVAGLGVVGVAARRRRA